jgi:phosphoribosylaminoimidazolecarboxamide formyltransferase / IMP cyclohydrolase
MIGRALLSVHDKTGLVDLGQSLADAGVEMISTGGTASALQVAGFKVRTVEELTGFPEILGGRVKTLHPAVHAGILARRQPDHLAELARLSLAPIDLVVVNLYPFSETIARPGCTLEEAIEQIDIGGVTLLRAAAKNYTGVVVLSRPEDYGLVIERLRAGQDPTSDERKALAVQAFAHTAAYDAAICNYLRPKDDGDHELFPASLDLHLDKVAGLRYGENPHQRAAFYRLPGAGGLPDARLLHGKALSYNNLLDLHAAWGAASSFSEPTVAIIKHNNPCGLASAASLLEAYRAALDSDPGSAYGGVIACNVPVDADTAAAISPLFVEAVIAPNFAPGALAMLEKKRDVRLLAMPAATAVSQMDMRRVSGGLLLQETDRFEDEADWKVATSRAPTAEERAALAFAWKVAAHVKSNAIVLVKGTATVGVGAGQMSRVDSTEIAIKKAGPDRARGSVLASDAYFPFADSIELAAQAGVTAVIQPGGSIRDNEVIAAANQHNIAMIVTGSRHFRH